MVANDAIRRLEELVSKEDLHHPDATALVDGSARLSYGELDRRSDELARALVARGVRPGDRVALLAPKSAEAIVALVGTLKAAAVCAPLDVTSPAPRLVRMLRALEPCRLVIHPESGGLAARCLDELGDASVSEVLRLGEDIAAARAERPAPGAAPDDLAVILFTSGSTGEPKGVPLTHEAVLHFVSWSTTHFGVGADDRVSCHSPLHFDAALWDIFRAFHAGAELHLVPARANLLPRSLAEFIRGARLTQWDSVPSVLVGMASRDVVAHGDFPELRRLIWYGEVFPTKALRYWMERLPHVTFTNTYGPTETTITASHYTVPRVPDDDAPIPIGEAVPGKRLSVLDADRRPVAPGVIGDLYIGGVGLSPGYFRDPDKTASAFVEAPPGSGERLYRTGDLARIDEAGIVHFHGRADRQIKSRGCRIELDEIAVALGRIAGLAESAVVAVAVDGFEGARICAAYVPMPGATRSPAELRAELSSCLPPYMLPARWLALDGLPKNPNGKIDHRALERRFLEER
ncbi:amino acid adenylation domain-containing protein [Sorangium sp. So ce302]|uniref:amino acid adenylation domain-containing protein n=1 Tax=Sorangium sp. So ce302 TaxID=3133297 RepID=UPI003F5F17CA